MSEEIALAIADLETAKELWAALAAVTQENTNLRTLLGVLQQRNAHAERVVQAARAIDKHRVGAYETDSGSVEPCDECGEMRDIAAQALAAYDEAVRRPAAE
jgi:hypothetical protein